MAVFDSTIRLRQANQPEFSGYTVQVIQNYLNGNPALPSTGVLSGVFYPLKSNPSGFVTSGQTGIFKTQIDLDSLYTQTIAYVAENYTSNATVLNTVTTTGNQTIYGDKTFQGIGVFNNSLGVGTTPYYTLDVFGEIGNSNGYLPGAYIDLSQAKLIEDNGNNSVNWNSHTLRRSTNNVTVDWENWLLYSNSYSSVDWGNRNLDDISGNHILYWSNGKIGIGKTATTSLNVSGDILLDNGNLITPNGGLGNFSNIFGYSSQLANNPSYWVAYGLNTTLYNSSEVSAPNGTYTAIKSYGTGFSISFPTTQSGVYAVDSNTKPLLALGTPYVLSCWLKNTGNPININFGINDQNSTSFILPTSDWIRYTYKNTGLVSSVGRGFQTYTQVSGATYFVWGPQLEIGSGDPGPYVATTTMGVNSGKGFVYNGNLYSGDQNMSLYWASTGYVANASGYLKSLITNSSAGVNYLNVTGLNISGNVALTGVNGITLYTGANNTIYISGSSTATFSNVVYTTGDQTVSGYKTFAQSGNFLNGISVTGNVIFNYQTITTGSSNIITIDFSTGEYFVNITGASGQAYTITGINIPAAPYSASTSVFLYNTGTCSGILTFPNSWIFLGSKPSGLITGKSSLLSLKSYGTTVAAGYSI